MRWRIVVALIGAIAAQSALAQVGCTLTLGLSGKMTMSGDGTTLGSENILGSNATLTVAGLTSARQVSFASHIVTGPTGWSGSPVTLISVTSSGGARQPYTAANFTVRSGLSPDAFVINAKVLSASGFKAGNYDVSTQVTCQAA